MKANCGNSVVSLESFRKKKTEIAVAGEEESADNEYLIPALNAFTMAQHFQITRTQPELERELVLALRSAAMAPAISLYVTISEATYLEVKKLSLLTTQTAVLAAAAQEIRNLCGELLE